MLLFLNINSSILDKAVGSNHLLNMVRQHRIKPNDIVIEINESKVRNTIVLKNFVDTYRNHGFLIALDDVGYGFSNLDRIPLIKPDIVKTDISLMRNICSDFYVQEVFRSMVSLSMKIGALVVAEGVETEEEAVRALELGANMTQGYCLAKPQKLDNGIPGSLNDRITAIAGRFQNAEREKIIWKRKRYNKFKAITSGISMRLASVSANNFDNELLKAVNCNNGMECVYILDENGIQSSSTIFSGLVPEIKNNRLFSPAKTGNDHSLKIYYRYLKSANTRRYITEPYASLASGNL